MITLHDAKETNFEKNGYGVLDDLIFNDGGSWEMNGEFKIAFEVPALTEFTKYLEARNIVQAPVPFMERQLFRIYRTEQTLTSIYVEARHIFYDLLDNWIEDTNIVGQVGNSAIQQLLSRTQYPHRFTATSNISKTANARIVRMNPVEAIIDDGKENTLVSRWGGELVRNNFHIEMLERMGADRGVRIEHKKDLMGYNATIDVSTIVTRIHPVGFDGLELPEKYVDSPLIDLDHPIIAEVKYEDIKAAVGEYADDEEAVPLDQAYELLRQAAADEFAVNHVDEPETVVEVDFVALHNTEQYKDFADLQEVKAGDTVKVSAPDHGFEITSRLVGFEFSLLKKDHYTSTTLGNHVLEYTSSEPDVGELRQRVEAAERAAVIALTSANGRNRNFYGADDPNTIELGAQLGDQYFREDGEFEATYLYVEVNGEKYWKRTSIDEEALRNEIAQQQEDLEAVKQSADESAQSISDAISGSGFLDLDDMLTNMRSISEETRLDAESAMIQAITNAGLIGDMETSISNIDLDIDEINGTISLKADVTEIDRIDGTITDINNELTFQSGELSSKISQTQLQGAIDGIEVGGRNYVIRNDEYVNTYITVDGSIEPRSGHSTMKDKIPVTPGEVLTFTKSGDTSNYWRWRWFDENEDYISRTASSSNEFQWVVPSNTYYIQVSYHIDSYPKIEKGNKATDWTPAPEDTTELISSIQTEWTQTFEEFETSVTGSNGRLTLAEQFLDGFRNTAFDPSTGQLSLTEQTIAGLQDTVSDPVNGLETRVTTIANGFQALSSDVDGLESQLAVTNENVLARVEKGDVYSQLLIDSRNILFDANDRIMLSADKVVIDASEGTFISGAVIQDASIDTTQIADAAITDAKVINLDVDKLTGNRSEFIQTYWNDINSSAEINANEFRMNQGNDSIRLTTSGLRFYNGNEITSAIYNHMTVAEGIAETVLKVERNRYFTFNVVDENGIEVPGFRIGHWGYSGFYTNINMWNNDILNAGNIEAVGIQLSGHEGLAISDAGRLIGSSLGGISLLSDERVSLGIGNISGWSTKMIVRPDLLKMYENLEMDGNNISQVNELDVNNVHVVGGGRILKSTSGALTMLSPDTAAIGIGNPTGWTDSMRTNANTFALFRTLNMNGHSITNQSDGRYKTITSGPKSSSLDVIRKWNFVHFYYTDKETPDDERFGLIAQETPDLLIYDDMSEKFGIDTSKQIMMNSHAIQQLAYGMDDLIIDIEMNRLNQNMIDSEQDRRIEELERIVEEQSEEIRQLKGAA